MRRAGWEERIFFVCIFVRFRKRTKIQAFSICAVSLKNKEKKSRFFRAPSAAREKINKKFLCLSSVSFFTGKVSVAERKKLI